MLLQGPTGQPHSGLRLACPTETPGAILALTQGILPSPAGRFLPPGCAFQGPQGVVPVPAQGGLCLHSCVTPGTAPAPTLGISVPLTLTWVLHHCQDLGAAPLLILGGGLPLPLQHGDHPCPETRDYCHLTLNPVLQPLWDSQEWPLYPLPKGFLPPSPCPRDPRGCCVPSPGGVPGPQTHAVPRVSPAGILKNRLQYPLVPQTRGAPELSWCRAATLGHRAVPAASYGRICAGGGTGSLSQPASRYSSREQLDLLLRRQLSRERLEEAPSPVLRPLSRPGSQERLDTVPGRSEPRDRGSTLPRRQPPRDYPGATAGRFGSRDALDRGAPCKWLSTLPPPRGAQDLDPQPLPLALSPQQQLSRDPLLPARPLDSLSKRSNSGERLDHAPSRHPSREGLGPAPQLLRAREAPPSGPGHGPSTEQLDVLSSILASFNSSALSSSLPSSSTPSGPHTTATASALGPSTPRSATSHSISELSPDSE